MQLQKVLEDAIVCHLYGKEKAVILCDRGIFDNRAYMTEEMWQEVIMLCFPNDVHPEDTLARYDGVLHLVSAACDAPQHYKNTAVRKETVDQAAVLDKHTYDAWTGHPHRMTVAGDIGGMFEGKVTRAISAIRSLIEETEKRRDDGYQE